MTDAWCGLPSHLVVVASYISSKAPMYSYAPQCIVAPHAENNRNNKRDHYLTKV